MSKEKALNYLEKKAESDVEASLLQFSLLLEKAVGIGDHSTTDFYNNAEEAARALAEADDVLDTLKRYYKE